MFRPYRSQVAHVYNDNVTDFGIGFSAGAEFGAGNLAHVGVNFLMSPSTSSTGKWINKNNVLPLFTEKNTDKNNIEYEPYAFKLVGETNVDLDDDFNNNMRGSKALRIKLSKSRYNNQTTSQFDVKNGVNSANYTQEPISKIKRNQRYLRNQLIQKISDKDAITDPFITRSTYAKQHHTAGMKVLQTDGSTYVYGQAVYNKSKVEATFDVSGKSGGADYETGTLSGITDRSGNNSNNSDKYYNKITTPAYAHSYLLTSVLSSDYEDVNGDGPSENDLGSYTKFVYGNKSDNYKWRVPYESDKVTFNEGLKSHTDDEKGNYLYGEKELTYLKRIVTKTHVAIFSLSERDDARGAKEELGNSPNSAGFLYKIDKISLYSLVEAKAANLLDDNINNDGECIPIKEAHFVYNYKLCKGTPNNFATENGKLTLEKLYFTYRNSKMGEYTPYVFTYWPKNNPNNPSVDENNQAFNANYHLKGFDVWGNYKPVDSTVSSNINSPLTNSEFPFVEQDKDTADKYTAMWVLKTIKLPSGGVMKITTESDDYKYIQNKKAMQMFKVIGCGSTKEPNDSELINTELYQGNNHIKYIYVDLGENSNEVASINENNFKVKYLSENENNPLYFKFLLNMTSNNSQFDYVSGYININGNVGIVTKANRKYVAIPLKSLKREGGISSNMDVNPITKAGWGFGRMYLNKVVYSLGGNSSNTNFVSIVQDLVGSISTISELWKGPNKALQDKGCAKIFKPGKSWIRLENPNGRKLGGGLRVKSIELSDNWDVMTSNIHNDLYKQKYGQVYDYTLEDGTSSGVATFEPNASPENPFVLPLYPNKKEYADRIAAPKEQNYVETPFGESFFPSPKVTYSRVTVSNLERVNQNNNNVVLKRHATGKVITSNYTSKDFPTKVEYTDIDMAFNPHNPISGLLNILSVDHLVASQGYSIETNDMDGKMKKQEIFAEDSSSPISSVEYKYSVDANDPTKLNNNLTTINKKGLIETNQLGVEYDIINDFNESNSQSYTMGFDGNLAVMLYGIFPSFVPTVLPKISYHENILRTAVTTKVVHKTGILKEKIAYDLGSRVSTENLAWDSNSGQVILTKTNNEFDDAYYSLNYPAYWAYESMGLASNNIGIQGKLYRIKGCTIDPTPYFKVKDPSNNNDLSNLKNYFQFGDELIIQNLTIPNELPYKVWVTGFSSTNDGLLLMDKLGNYIDNCGENQNSYNFNIVRSGYRNTQSASMASITTMINPIDVDRNGIIDVGSYIPDFDYDNTSTVNPRIINASAIEYNDFWKPQDEGMAEVYNASNSSSIYPTMAGQNQETSGEISHPYKTGYNPYLWNVKGEWRAEKSYAYLTSRESNTASTRNKGFFTKFSPFYKRSTNWGKNASNWTFASSITKYSPYGAELENKDALNRYSAAQYGYNYNLPMAVASNSRYNEMGFEGFEDTSQATGKKHFQFTNLNNSLLNLSSNFSHTGRKSVKVASGNNVKMIKKLGATTNIAQMRECSFSCSQLVALPAIVDGQYFPPANTNLGVELEAGSIYYQEFIISSQCGLSINGTSKYYTNAAGNVTSIPMYIYYPDSSNPTQIKIRVYGAETLSMVNNDPNNPNYVQQSTSFDIEIFIGGYPLILNYVLPHNTVYSDGNMHGGGFQPGYFNCN